MTDLFRSTKIDAAALDEHRGMRGANVSRCERFRFSLFRTPLVGNSTDRDYPARLSVHWHMLNPSTADARTDDATIRRVTTFSMRWARATGRSVDLFGVRVVVTNLSPLRATNPTALRDISAWSDAIAENRRVVANALCRADVVVLAWGAHGARPEMKDERDFILNAARHLEVPTLCLGRTSTAEPAHPVRLPGATPFVPWRFDA